MAKTREKKVVIAGVTREEFEDAFAKFADADARLQQMTAKMDVEITRIREKYQDNISFLGELKDDAFEKMQVWAMENKDELFAKRKSIESTHGTVGFRTGTPKLKLLKGFTWGAVTNLLKEFLPTYVRISEEPAKDKLLSDREDPEVCGVFTKVGIFVDQDEMFFVEPKKEATETVKV
jgi:phage host-nuclease inhibitor protein Gam